MTSGTQTVQSTGIGEITRLLQQMPEGEPHVADKLMSHVYNELRKLAAFKMAREMPGQTLQPTALVHEAWLRLVGGDGQRFADRAYFFAAAGEAMRRILVENARRKKRLKRGGRLVRVDLDDIDLPAPLPDDELLALDEALNSLVKSDARAAQVVNLCFFVGLTHEQAAKELEVSLSTIERTWAYARAWLFREIRRAHSPPG